MTLAQFLESVFLGIGLSMDALAVSIALAVSEGKCFTWKKILLTAGLFGFFQAAMPLAGWFGGSLCGEVVQTFGRYPAAVLLAFIGGKMLWDRKKEEKVSASFKALVVLSFATSIDALLVGVGYACLGRTGIGPDVVTIGCTTFLISLGGCIAGRISGSIFGNKCEILGGLVLIGLALKFLFFG